MSDLRSRTNARRRSDLAKIAPYIIGLVAIPVSLQGIMTDIAAFGLNWTWVMVRVGLVPLGVLAMVAYRSRLIKQRAPALPIIAVILYITAEILYFIGGTGVENSLYYHSIIQLLFGITMLPLSVGEFAIAFGVPVFGFLGLVISHSGLDIGLFRHGQLLFFKTYVLITMAIFIVTNRVRSRLYKKYIELEDELGSREATIARQVAELSEATTAKAIAKTTQMLAHDVRKPFSILRMGISMLGNARDPAAVKSILARVVPEIDKAVRSVDGLIADVMEVGSDSVQLIKESASPESLIEATLGETFRIYTKANIKLTYDLKHTRDVDVHVQKVGRVFSNIVGNAVQAMRSEGTIWFRTRDTDGAVEFCVGNGGSHISMESLPKLFEAFFTSGKKGGTGLGLAIAEKVVKAHGGKIWCESSKTSEHPDGKVEFFFTLPATDRQANGSNVKLPDHSCEIAKSLAALTEGNGNAAALSSTSQSEVDLEQQIIQAGSTLGRSLRVLIVDDEDVYRQALATTFTRTPDLSNALVIRIAADSGQALELAQKSPFDLVITDVDMGPGSLNGFDLVERLRALPGFGGGGSLICVHSNRIVAADHKSAIDSGGDAFVSKPASRAQLLKLVLQAAEKAASTGEATRAVATVPVKPEVLIVDDNPFILEAWADTLSPGAVVHLLSSPEALMTKLDKEPHFLARLACVITDNHFDGSGSDGLDVGRLVKSLRSDLPVFLSSDGDVHRIALEDAIDKSIEKDPIGIDRLKALFPQHC